MSLAKGRQPAGKARISPTRKVERDLFLQGYEMVAGVDEVGRGALAGPVVAAAVIVPYRLSAPWVKRVRDSKMLLAADRDRLGRAIAEAALAVGVGAADSRYIDSRGIVPATRLAMQRAVENLQVKPHFIMVDAVRLPAIPIPQMAIIKGDRDCFVIACASIIAKTYRDNLMKELAGSYPGYYLERHKGYGTSLHLRCLDELGPSAIHRCTFAPVAEVIRFRSPVKLGENELEKDDYGPDSSR